MFREAQPNIDIERGMQTERAIKANRDDEEKCIDRQIRNYSFAAANSAHIRPHRLVKDRALDRGLRNTASAVAELRQ